jgi:hypothetical protein
MSNAPDSSALLPDSEEASVSEPTEHPHVDFGTFVMSLATSALVHLGEVPHPDDRRLAAALPLARQTIDMLGMLQDKTRGNLTKQEAELLDFLLIDLRMKYVAATRS